MWVNSNTRKCFFQYLRSATISFTVGRLDENKITSLLSVWQRSFSFSIHETFHDACAVHKGINWEKNQKLFLIENFIKRRREYESSFFSEKQMKCTMIHNIVWLSWDYMWNNNMRIRFDHWCKETLCQCGGK